MKRALIITYYWPPSGGAGVQRWIRFVSQMRVNGWEPVLCIPENPHYVVTDETLSSQLPVDIEIIKTPIWEPNSILKTFQKKRGNTLLKSTQKPQKTDLLKRLLWTIRGNFFIPDARKFWIKPSIRLLSKILVEKKIDVIISTGPPHSSHLIAKGLKAKFNIPWLADFRDPWVSMDYLKEMNLSSFAWRKHLKLEANVFQHADEIVVVGKTMQDEFEHKYQRKIHIIYNGYNQESGSNHVNYPLTEKFTIVHIGNFLRDRNCDDLWEVLSKFVENSDNLASKLEIKLVGEVAENVIESLTHCKLMNYVTIIPYIPFSETQMHLYSAQVLLLPIDRIKNASFVLTGKLFEYIKSHRPIVLIGPKNGDAATLLNHCKAGFVCDFNDKTAIKQTIELLFTRYLANEKHDST